MSDCRFHGRLNAKLLKKKGFHIEVAEQVETRTWSDLSKPIWQRSSRIAYSPYFLYEERIAMLQVLTSEEDGFQSLSQAAFVNVEGPVNSEEDFDRAARKRPETVGFAIRLLTLEFSINCTVVFETVHCMLWKMTNCLSVAQCTSLVLQL